MINEDFFNELSDEEQEIINGIMEAAEKIEEAIQFAQAHMGSIERFDGDTGFDHAMRVAAAVQRSEEWKSLADDPELSSDMVIAAILHDIVEDCGVSVDEIIDKFGLMVGAWVDKLTHKENKGYIDYIQSLNDDKIACVIKRADMADNLQTLPFNRDKLWSKYLEAIPFLYEAGK